MCRGIGGRILWRWPDEILWKEVKRAAAVSHHQNLLLLDCHLLGSPAASTRSFGAMVCRDLHEEMPGRRGVVGGLGEH
ncbi:hypothetical protein F2Q69_00046879 [Brassica cretica]|uniref:Uncharacterized protein n=1 Tax=Brassica cretica TaxID=69181 RepID=A0A8S9Q675_BRACR|nr:hypothetical protein F2Q69_00046879 [Brassica cretica]